MSRRIVLTVAVLLAVAGLVAPAGAASSRAAAAPANGRCYNLTYYQTGGWSSTAAAVSCSSKHTTRTFSVTNVSSSVDYKHLDPAQISKAAAQACYSKFAALLGSSAVNRHLTAYSYIFFVPTSTQRAAGARWLRCDVVLLGGQALRALPTNTAPFVQGAITDATKRCLVTTDHLYTTCSGVHSYRSSGAYVLTSGTQYRTTEQFVANGRKYCPNAEYYTWPNRYAWSAGDHVLVCYDRTAS